MKIWKKGDNMARLSKKETEIKLDASWQAFEVLKNESDGQPNNKATFDNILTIANEDERILALGQPIGRTTLVQPRGKGFVKLNKAISEYREEHKKRKILIPKKAKGKIENLNEQLQSAMESCIKLQEEVHSLQKRLDNKEHQIKQIEKDRNEFASIVADLRVKYEH